MEITNYLSRKITFISFFMSLFIVLRHSMMQDLLHAGVMVKCKELDFYFQNLLSDVWGQIAVPFFFVFSGFFMLGKFQKGVDFLKNLLLKKFHGLVVPYLFWTISSFAVMFLIQNLPGISRFFNSELILEKSFLSNLLDILDVRYVRQFWYVQHLILLTLISPLLFWYSQKTKWVGLIAVFIAYTFFETTFNYLKFGSIFYFLCGGIASMYPTFINFKLPKKWLLSITLLFVTLSLIMVSINYMEKYKWEHEVFLDKVIILFGIGYFWLLYDFIEKKIWNFRYSKIYYYSFAIFALHYSTLLVGLKKIYLSIFHTGEAGLFFTYVLTFITTSFFCIIVSDYIFRKVPKLYHVATGGRLPRTNKFNRTLS